MPSVVSYSAIPMCPGKRKMLPLPGTSTHSAPTICLGFRLECRRQRVLEIIRWVRPIQILQVVHAFVAEDHAGEIALWVEIRDDDALAHQAKHPAQVEDRRRL